MLENFNPTRESFHCPTRSTDLRLQSGDLLLHISLALLLFLQLLAQVVLVALQLPHAGGEGQLLTSLLLEQLLWRREEDKAKTCCVSSLPEAWRGVVRNVVGCLFLLPLSQRNEELEAFKDVANL